MANNTFIKQLTIKKKDPNIFIKKIKLAVKELNDVKAGKAQAKDFDDLLNEL